MGQTPSSSTRMPSGTSVNISRALMSGRLSHFVVLGAQEHALQHPQQVGRAEDDAQGADDRDRPEGREGAEEDHRLADEAAQAGQAQRREEREAEERRSSAASAAPRPPKPLISRVWARS